MHKYVFTLRPDSAGFLYIADFVDASPLINVDSAEAMEKICEVIMRMDPDDNTAPLMRDTERNLKAVLGLVGGIRRRANITMSGPYCVMWEDDEALTFKDLEDYINALPPEKRREWLKGARI